MASPTQAHLLELSENRDEKSAEKSLNSPSVSVDISSAEKKNDLLGEELVAKAMVGYRYSTKGDILFWIAALLTGGISLLFNYWFPRRFLNFRYQQSPLRNAQLVHVIGAHKDAFEICPVEEILAEPLYQRLEKGQSASFSGRLDIDTVSLEKRMIIFRYARYLFDVKLDTFVPLLPLTSSTTGELRKRAATGLDDAQYKVSSQTYGKNLINIRRRSIPSLLIDEVLHPFFIFQLFSIILWCNDNYWQYSIAIAVIAVGSMVSTLYETYSNIESIRKLAHLETEVTVLRNGKAETISSAELVPGDVVQLRDQSVIPCDMALLQGSAVMNEAMLTGESAPVVKTWLPLPHDPNAIVSLGSVTANTLFQGTKLIQLKPSFGHNEVRAMVVRTGFLTARGRLISSILFPTPTSFRFLEQSYKFVFSMFAISMAGLGIAVWQLNEHNAETDTLIIRSLSIVTIVVPPALPMSMSVGTNYALQRLKNLKLFCTSPARINYAGKLKVMCFDKTGTLTTDSMEVMGVAEVDNQKFGEPTRDYATLQGNAFKVLSCCHSLRRLGSTMVGDPMEIAILRSADDKSRLLDDSDFDKVVESANPSPASLSNKLKYVGVMQLPLSHRDKIGDEPVGSSKLVNVGTVRVFEFVSELQRMSVLVLNKSEQGSHFSLLTKGSPELLASICVPNSLPADYNETLSKFTKKGLRVLALASRQFQFSVEEAATIQSRDDNNELRAELEKDLTFAGFLILENPLKPETTPALKRLHEEAHLHTVMVTGDNINTAISTARACSLLSSESQVYASEIVNEGIGKPTIRWRNVDQPNLLLDPVTLLPPADAPKKPVELACNGQSFQLMYENHTAEYGELRSDAPGHFVAQKNESSIFLRVVATGTVFARMTPSQKALLVTYIQSLGTYVGMCGDGANDCGALKAAHVGVSLVYDMAAEASVAAPFTCTKPDISCIPLLLSEGRCSLATAFQLFKYMAMYSMLQFVAILVIYFYGSDYGVFQYLFGDLFLVFPLVIFMGATAPNPILSIKRPSGDLLSRKNLLTIYSHLAICFTFHVVLSEFLYPLQPKDDPEYDPDQFTTGTWNSTGSYYLVNFQYLIYVYLWSLGNNWKAPIYKNYQLCIWLVICFGASFALTLVEPPTEFFFFEEDAIIDATTKLSILFFIFGSVGASILWELTLPTLFRVFPSLAKAKKPTTAYKKIRQELNVVS